MQYQSIQYSDILYNAGLLNLVQKQQVAALQNQLLQSILTSNFSAAYAENGNLIETMINLTGGNSIYDIREYNTGSPNSNIVLFMNLKSTQQLLHTPSYQYFYFNQTVENNYGPSFCVGVSDLLPFIIDNIRVLVTCGQDDAIVSSEGMMNVFANTQWRWMNNFLRSRKIIYKVQENIAGYAQTYLNFNYITVLKAGHEIGVYQPAASLDITLRFIRNQGWN